MKLLEDVVDDDESACYVKTDCYTQDVVNPLLFTTTGKVHVITSEAIKGVVRNITFVNRETLELEEGEYYLLLASLNRSTDTTSPSETDEQPVQEMVDEQDDEDSITINAG